MKLAELEDLKQITEGGEERRMLLCHYGYTLFDCYFVIREETREELWLDSARW